MQSRYGTAPEVFLQRRQTVVIKYPTNVARPKLNLLLGIWIIKANNTPTPRFILRYDLHELNPNVERGLPDAGTKAQLRGLPGSGVHRNFFRGGGVQQIQLRTEDSENGDLGAVGRGSGGTCNLVQEISFHIVKFSWFFVL